MTLAPTNARPKPIRLPSARPLPEPIETAIPIGGPAPDPHVPPSRSPKPRGAAAALPLDRDQTSGEDQAAPVPVDLLPLIRHLGRTLDDLESLRIRHQNRRGALARELRLELPPDSTLVELAAVEHQAELELCRLWRKHPLAPWAKSVRGVGEKSIARLISEIDGDRVDRETGEVRGAPLRADTVSQLWAYCGYDPTRRRRKGMGQAEALACGNPSAKKRCWLIATSMLKAGNRDVYDARRAHTAETHPDWTAGHSHNDALRVVAKQFLKDLWIASRHDPRDTHSSPAGGKS